MSAYFYTSSVLWAYPTTESLDDLDASRTGVHHHVMYTTPSLPTMLLHMIWFPRYRFWEFTIVLHIKMHNFTWKIARIHTSYTESLASCSYIYICIHIYILNEWMCNTAREIDAAAQPLSHSGRAADAATQPLWVTEWLESHWNVSNITQT